MSNYSRASTTGVNTYTVSTATPYSSGAGMTPGGWRTTGNSTQGRTSSTFINKVIEKPDARVLIDGEEYPVYSITEKGDKIEIQVMFPSELIFTLEPLVMEWGEDEHTCEINLIHVTKREDGQFLGIMLTTLATRPKEDRKKEPKSPDKVVEEDYEKAVGEAIDVIRG